MRKRILLTLILSVTFLVFFSHLNANSKDIKEQQISYVLISAKELAGVNSILRNSIKTLFSNAQETYLEYNSPEGKKYLEKLNITSIPFVIYNSSVVNSDNFLHMARYNMINKVKGYYVIPEEQLRRGEIMFLERVRHPHKLYIFITSFCPNAKRVIARIINFIRQNGLDITIQLKYLGDFNEFGLTSRYGPDELKEDIRQIIIQKYYPKQFLDYLLLIQNKSTEQALKKLGISLEYIDSKKEEAIKNLKEDFAAAKDLKIINSPTFLWENIYLIPTLTALKQHEPFNMQEFKTQTASKKMVSGPIPVDFFYSDSCSYCRPIKRELLPQIEARFKDKIVINYHDISDIEQLRLKFTLEKEYGILTGSIPVIFLPNIALQGSNAIKKRLSSAISEMLQQSEQPVQKEENVSQNDPLLDKFSSFSPAVVAFAGLADGINPCAFATIVFFVSFLALNRYRKDQIGYIGSAFIIAVFLTYLGLGLGIYQILKKVEIFSFLSKLIYYAIALLALGLAIYSLWDYIRYRKTGQTKGCNLRLYNRLRTIADSRRGLVILIIIALINGFIIAMLESACTGQVYFPIIAFVLKIPNLRVHALFYLILYNLLFILPLVIIFILAYKGATSEKFALFEEKYRGPMKLMYAALFFGLALFLFIF
jgi:thiol-disulfide isomerase/thioredoxin